MNLTKLIFRLNLALIIINIFLIVMPFFALLFLMVVGGFQVLFSIILGFQFNKMSPTIKVNYLIYILLTASVLYTFYVMNKGYIDSNDSIAVVCMLISIGLLFQNFFITYKVQES